jgi:hypothetical protein
MSAAIFLKKKLKSIHQLKIVRDFEDIFLDILRCIFSVYEGGKKKHTLCLYA